MSEELHAPIRRWPIYLLLDCSASMAGEPVEAARLGLGQLLSDLRADPEAVKTAWLSIITFADEAEQLVTLTGVGSFPDWAIDAATVPGCCLGAALELLMKCLDTEVRKTTAAARGDYSPLVFVVTSGRPTDDWEAAADELRTRRSANVIACGAGPGADETVLKRTAQELISLPGTSLGSVADRFVPRPCSPLRRVPRSADTSVELPPPPTGLKLIP